MFLKFKAYICHFSLFKRILVLSTAQGESRASLEVSKIWTYHKWRTARTEIVLRIFPQTLLIVISNSN